jgi:hypothetical protein
MLVVDDDDVVVVCEAPYLTETRVYMDIGSAATELFIALYVSSKTYVLPATEVFPYSSCNDIPPGSA